jgi:hypothetical protein
MPRRNRKPAHRRPGGRNIRVRGVRRERPDTRKLARALIGLAMAQAEADARAQADRTENEPPQAKDEAPPQEPGHAE